jgi:aryl-alcohol dehydrogenase-like predicted oxidoreductase
VVAPVIGARTTQQLNAALASDDLELPIAISDALDAASAIKRTYPETVGRA